LHGNVETCSFGRILGHEGIGYIHSVGSKVSRFKVGDKVLISCITSCGKCDRCVKEKAFGHCEDGGWLLGNTIDGCQAEYVKIPHADFSLYNVKKEWGGNEDAIVMLSDILPTGLEVGVVAGRIKEGDSVAVVGVGPVGLATIMAATAFKPSQLIAIDVDQNRLNVARSLGATHVIDNSDGTAVDQVMKLTGRKGIQVVIEAIGTPKGWDICENIVCAGGNIALLGVHGKPVTLHLERMWKHNFTLTAGLVHTDTIPALMQRTLDKAINPLNLISHRFKMSQMMEAYDTFSNASKHKSLKVIIENDNPSQLQSKL